eukprot:4888342-Prymnesium_polylepis.1
MYGGVISSVERFPSLGLKMGKRRLKSVISSRFLGVSRRRTHLKYVAGASQDGGVSKWTSTTSPKPRKMTPLERKTARPFPR